MADADLSARMAAFDWLRRQVDLHGHVLPWQLLLTGFEFHGTRVPLVSQQGIFKPRVLAEMPLSIRTSPDGPYADTFDRSGLLSYAYRGTDPDHHDNESLRLAMARKVPLVYLFGVLPGRYFACWPAFVVGADPARLQFEIQLDDVRDLRAGIDAARAVAEDTARPLSDESVDGRRRYVTALVRQRLHQQAFRERVLRAYREQCALCRLRHQELLDAAHIIADAEESGGEPVVENGLALCKLHHAAFDRYFLAVRPDYVVEVRREVLEEDDGPMLVHGLKALHGLRIGLPRSRGQWPDRERLSRRYEEFRAT